MKKSFADRHGLDANSLAKGRMPPIVKMIEQIERTARRRLARARWAKARLKRAVEERRPRPPAKPKGDDDDAGLFFVKWLQSPLRIGAVAPSSRYLARAMAREAQPALRQLLQQQPEATTVIELGGGTGSITRALLEGGLPAERLVVVERDRRLHAILQRRFPQLRVIQGDARDLVRLMAGLGITEAAAIVSSLPLISMPKQLRRQIVEQSFALLGDRGSLIQFTYSLAPPLSARDHGLSGRLATRVWLNLPPAAVWRFRRDPDALAA